MAERQRKRHAEKGVGRRLRARGSSFQTFLCCPPPSTRTFASLLLYGESEDQDQNPLISKNTCCPCSGASRGSCPAPLLAAARMRSLPKNAAAPPP